MIMKKFFYILSAAVVMATACTREMNPATQSVVTTTVAPADGDLALVTFSITVPETALYAVQTRADLPDQPTIANGDLYVAVFGQGDGTKVGIGGQLQHFLKANLKQTIEHDVDMTSTTTTDEETGESTTTITRVYTYEYEVLMPLSNEPLVLDFMAGACDGKGVAYTLANPLPVKYEAEVMPLLFSVDGNPAYWQRVEIPGIFPLIVNGEYQMTDYKDPDDPKASLPAADQDYIADPSKTPELDNVQLVRNFAKITYSASTNAAFELNGFYLVDVPKSGTVAPYTTAEGYDNIYTSANSAAAVYGAYNGYVGSQVLVTGFDSSKQFTAPGSFEYMYERTIPTQSSPVFAESGAILKVTWDPTKVTDTKLKAAFQSNPVRYYKVSFVNDKGYIPILRNIQYNFEVSDISAEQHPTSAKDAYDGGFLGDVSANITTAMLDEISNNKSRIKVSGDDGSNMSHTVIGAGRDINVDFWFYPVASNSEVVVTDGKTSTAASAPVAIKVSILDVDGYDQAIDSKSEVFVTRNGNSDQYGTVTVTTKSSVTGKVQKGKLRILGQVEGLRALYRDIEFVVMEKQDFAITNTSIDDEGETVTSQTWSSVTTPINDAKNQDVTVMLRLPEALPRDIFPLQIKIEAEKNNLTSVSDNTVTPAIPALPVQSGESAFGGSHNGYYFVKTITFDEYAHLSGVSYEYTTEFPCKFKTRLSSGNATSIKINDLNEVYFNEATLTVATN